MKKIVKTFMVSATLVAALLVAVAAQAKDATLTGATGTVESLGKGGTWQSVSVNKSVKVGSTLRTGSTAGSLASFRLPNVDGLIVLNEATTLTLSEASSKTVSGQNVSDTVLSLAAGRVTGKVGGLNGASSFVVKTPSKNVVVKGQNAEFSVGADGSVTVTRGTVDVGTGGQMVAVAAGQTLAANAAAPVASQPGDQASIATQVAYGSRTGNTDGGTPPAGDALGERNVTNPQFHDIYLADGFLDNVERGTRSSVSPLKGGNAPEPMTPAAPSSPAV